MGLPTALSMNLGMLVGWGILSPLAKSRGWAPGPVGDMATGARGWILWTSLAIMVSDSVVSLLPVVREFAVKAMKPVRRRGLRMPATPVSPAFVIARPRGREVDDEVEGEGDVEPLERLVPVQWVLWGLGGSIVSGTLLVWFVFGAEGIRPWATVIGYLMGGVLSLLGCVVVLFRGYV